MSLTIDERIDRLLQRIVDMDIEITSRHILRNYLARDRTTTLKDIAKARLQNLAAQLAFGADPVTDACGWALMIIIHRLPEPTDQLPLLLLWAEDGIEDPHPTTVFPFVWSERAAV